MAGLKEKFQALSPEEQEEIASQLTPAEFARVLGAPAAKPAPAGFVPKGAEIPSGLGFDLPTFLTEAGRRAGEMAATAGPSLVGAAGGAALGAPAGLPGMVAGGVLGAGGAEAGRQLLSRLFGLQAPQTGAEAAQEIGLAALGGIVPPARAISKIPRALKPREIAALRAARVEELTPRLEEAERQVALQTARTKQAQLGIKEAARARREVFVQKAQKAKEQVEQRIQERVRSAVSEVQQGLGAPTAPTEIRLAREAERTSLHSKVNEAYDAFRASKGANDAFVSQPVKDLALLFRRSLAQPPGVINEIIDAPDVITVKLAEDYLSTLKSLARVSSRELGRTKAQGVAAKLSENLGNLIENTLSVKDPEALKHLKTGRQLARLEHEVFERGPGKVGLVVSRRIERGAAVETFAKNPETLERFLIQTRTKPQTVARGVFDSVVQKAIDPSTGQFSKARFATEWNKFPKEVRAKLFGDKQNEIATRLAQGDEAIFAKLKNIVRENLREMARQGRVALHQERLESAKKLGRLNEEVETLASELSGQRELVKGIRPPISGREKVALAGGAIGSYFAAKQFGYPAYRAVRELLGIAGE